MLYLTCSRVISLARTINKPFFNQINDEHLSVKQSSDNQVFKVFEYRNMRKLTCALSIIIIHVRKEIHAHILYKLLLILIK